MWPVPPGVKGADGQLDRHAGEPAGRRRRDPLFQSIHDPVPPLPLGHADRRRRILPGNCPFGFERDEPRITTTLPRGGVFGYLVFRG